MLELVLTKVSRMKKININKTFCLFILITIAFLGTLIKMEYALDTYFMFTTEPQLIIQHFIRSR